MDDDRNSPRPWMPLWLGDYYRETRHLSTAQHGCYILLLMHYWEHAGIPGEDAALARICGCRQEDWTRYYRAPVMALFEEPEGSGHRHTRLDRLLARVVEISNKRKDAALQKQSKSTSGARRLQSQSPEEDKQAVGELDFVSDDQTCRIPAEQFHEWAAKFGLTPARVRARWGGLYRDWLCHMPPERRRRAFEDKVAKDVQKNAVKATTNVTPIRELKPGDAGYWEQKMRKR